MPEAAMFVSDAIAGNIVHKGARVHALNFLYDGKPWFKEAEAEAEESKAEEPEESEAEEPEESEAEAEESEAEAAPAASAAATIPTTPPGKRTLDFSSLQVDVQRARKRLKSSSLTSEEMDEMLRDITRQMVTYRRAIQSHVYVRNTDQLEKELNHLERVLQESSRAHQAREDEMSKPSEAQKDFVAEKKLLVDVIVEKYNLEGLLGSLGISD